MQCAIIVTKFVLGAADALAIECSKLLPMDNYSKMVLYPLQTVQTQWSSARQRYDLERARETYQTHF